MGTSILRTHSIPAALITVSMAMGQDFGPPQVITSNADYATGLYAADLDADGDVDVLSASWLDDKIAWYENLGNGNTWRFQYWHRAGMNPSRFSKGIAGLIY